MKKAILIYASKHHGNTYKLAKAISEKYEIAMIDATKESIVDLQEYEVIGFASGIDFGKFYEEIENFAEANLPIKKEVFFLFVNWPRELRFRLLWILCLYPVMEAIPSPVVLLEL